MRKFRRSDISGFSQDCGVRFSNRDYAVACYRDEETNEIKTIVKRLRREFRFGDKYFDVGLNRIDGIDIIVCLIEILLFAALGYAIFSISFCIQEVLMYLGIYELIYFILFFMLYALLAFIVEKFKNESNNDLLRYHGAEHKVCNALEKKNICSDINVVRNASRYHPRCGVSIITNGVFVFTVFLAIHFFFHTFMPPIIIMYLISRIVVLGDPLSYFVQKTITTMEPTDEYMEVAMRAMQRLLELENGDRIRPEEETVYEKALKVKDEIGIFDEYGDIIGTRLDDDDDIEFYYQYTKDLDKQDYYERKLFMFM